MTTKLALYQKAARHLTVGSISGLTEDIHPVRVFDAIYAEVVQLCLEEGLWLWALRTVKLEYDPSLDQSDFGGRSYGFTMPDDFVRFANINSDPNFGPNTELGDYEWTGPGRTIYSNTNPIYVRYVSNGANYGLNLGAWPESFAEGVGYRMAEKSALPIHKDAGDRNDLLKLGDKQIAQAKIRNAVDERVKSRATGRLVRNRFRYTTGRSLRDSLDRG